MLNGAIKREAKLVENTSEKGKRCMLLQIWSKSYKTLPEKENNI